MNNEALFKIMLFFCFIQKVFCVDIDFAQRSFGSNILSIYWGFQLGKMVCLLAPVQLDSLDHYQRIGVRFGHGLFAYALAEGYKAFLQKKVWSDRVDIDHNCIQNVLALSGILFCSSYAAACSCHVGRYFPSLQRDMADCGTDVAIGYYMYSGFFASDPKKRIEKMLNASRSLMLSDTTKEKIFCAAKELYRQEYRFFMEQRGMFSFPRGVRYTQEQRTWLLNVQRICALSNTLFPVDIKQQIGLFIDVR